MKKIIVSIALIIVASSVFSQESYTVKMNLKVDGLPPEYAAYGEQEFVNYIKGDKYKMEISSMMMTATTAFDGKKTTQITESMGNKSGYIATKEELEADKPDKSATKPKVEYTTEKKTIAGYECSKAIVTSIDKDKKESKINVWVTDKIKNPEKVGKGSRGMSMDFGDLKGYPLEVEMKQNANGMDLKILITTSEVLTTNIEDSAFTLNTEGYTILSYKEYMEKMKAMSQGK